MSLTIVAVSHRVLMRKTTKLVHEQLADFEIEMKEQNSME
jgi:hypothetical protein